MSQMVEGPTRTFTAGEAIAQFLRVKGAPASATLAGASDISVGTAERVAASGETFAVRLRTAQGTRKMVASGAITAGNPVYAAAAGKIAGSGTVYEGIALETSTTNGDVIEVMPSPNTDLSTAVAGTTAAAFAVDSDATTPKIALSGQSGGTGDFTTTLKPETTLSGNNAIIVPEANGDVLCALALAQTLTNKTLGAPTMVAAAAITAAGTVQGDAAALTGVINTATGDGTVGVILPSAVAGLVVFVYNLHASAGLKVYPASGDDINDGTTNAAVTIEGKTLAMFIAVDTATWAAIYTANT